MEVRDRNVWITGASSGIGAALAVHLGRRGARLILSARREEKLREVHGCLDSSREHLVVPLDLGDPESIGHAVEATLPKVGHVDVLVNNGGVSQRALACDTDISVVRRIMQVNFLGTVQLTQALLPGMMSRRSGWIMVTSSLVGKFGTPLRSSYSASKHALHGYFDSLRAELWPHGIGVTMVCPGFVRTDVSLSALTAEGGAQGTMDKATASGLPAARCVALMVRAMEKERDEVIIAGKEGLAVWLKRFFPGLFNRVIRRARVT